MFLYLFRFSLIPPNIILGFFTERVFWTFFRSITMYLNYVMLLKMISSWFTIPLYHWEISSFISFIASTLFDITIAWLVVYPFGFNFLVFVYLRWFSYKQHVTKFYFFFIQSNNNILLLQYLVPSICVYCFYHFICLQLVHLFYVPFLSFCF